MAWQLWLSPPDEVNTVASCAGSMPAERAASRPTARVSLTTAAARRRSAACSACGTGSTVFCGA
jgi:hypothetical protein